jgi:hypothetical protein
VYAELSAQTPLIGLRVGTTVGSPIVSDIPEGSSGSAVVGILAGMQTEFDVSSTWSMQIDLTYTYLGSTFTTPMVDRWYVDRVAVGLPDGTVAYYDVETVFNGTAYGTFANDYLQLPVLARWGIADDWRLTMGAYAGYLLATGTTMRGVGTVGVRPELVDKNMEVTIEKMQRVDYGLVAGGQYRISIPVTIDLRITYGLNSIFDPTWRTIPYSVHNAYAQLSVGYALFQ